MQSMFGGMTSYDEQTVNDILEDLNTWIGYTEMIAKEMNERYTRAKESNFWDKVSYDFQLTIVTSMRYYKTIISDLTLVVSDVKRGCILEKHINLLRKIGNNACQYNNEYPKTFKDDLRWHEYGNPEFSNVEDMYAHGRDYFVTLQDALNAASRLEDYMDRGEKTVNNNITISGGVSSSNIQVGSDNANQNIYVCNEINYEEMLSVLERVLKSTQSEVFKEEFAEHSAEVVSLIEQSIEQAKKKEDIGVLKTTLKKILGFAENVAAGVVASGIYTQLCALPIMMQ